MAICQWVSSWLFCRPIKPLVVPLPISLWPIACVFSELIGESYLMLLFGRCYVGRGVEYMFLIFSSLQKFLYTLLSKYDPLSVIIDWCGPYLIHVPTRLAINKKSELIF